MFRYEGKAAVKKELIVSILYPTTNKYIAYLLFKKTKRHTVNFGLERSFSQRWQKHFIFNAISD